MPNVFGKKPRDYSVINSQLDSSKTDNQVLQILENSGCKVDWNHSFARKNFTSKTDEDTAAFGLVMNNLEALQQEIEEILRERFMVPEFIPINTSIPEGATSWSLRVVNRYGRGKFINKDGSNVETATASVDKLVFNVQYAGIQPEWTLQELRESLFSGISISNETLEAGTQGALNHIQDIGFEGDAEVGFEGLLNNSDVPVFGGTVPDFNTATADEIRIFVNDMIVHIGQLSDEILYQHFGNNELYFILPTVAFDKIATTPYGTDVNKTVAEWLKRNNAWTLRTGKDLVFKSLPRAADHAATGTGRAMVYPFTSRVFEMAIPIMPRVITTDNSSGYKIKAPMEYSMSGVNFKRGNLCLYADGVLGA